MKNLFKYISLLTVCAVIILASYLLPKNNPVAEGSIVITDGYYATTTPLGLGATTATIKLGYGQLGSVVVTGPKTGNFQLYDATTSNISARTGQLATTTILIADFPNGTATSTYQLDVTLKYGLLYVGSGSVATGTITYK